MNCERRGSIEQITIRANDSTICTTHSTYGHPKARCWSHIASAEDRHSTQPTCYPIPPTRSHSRKKTPQRTEGFEFSRLTLAIFEGWLTRPQRSTLGFRFLTPKYNTSFKKKKEERELARRKTGKSIERPEAGDI
jgi:hypothetical protein